MVLALKKRNLLILAAAMALLLTLVPIRVYAQTATVSATVMPAFVAVEASPSGVDYAVRALGSVDQIPSPDSFTATNVGNITADFFIRGDDTADWDLGGTAADEVYVHEASVDSGFTTPIVLEQASLLALASTVAPSGTATVWLRMDLPTTSAAVAVQTADVIIVAVIP